MPSDPKPPSLSVSARGGDRAGRACWAPAGSWLFLGLTLFVILAKVFHPLLHADAAAADHDCAIVHWAHGELGFSQATVSVDPPLPTIGSLLFSTEPVEASVRCLRLRNSRGPPSL